MGKTYRQEKEWGRKAARKPPAKQKNKAKTYSSNEKNYNEEELYYDSLEMEAYEEEYNERERKKR